MNKTYINRNLTPELRDNIKKYIQYCRSHKDELLNIDKSFNPYNLPPFIKQKIDKQFGLQLEVTTSSAVGAYSTPYAFSKRGIGNVKAAKMFGFQLCGNNKSVKKEDISIINNDPVMKYKDQYGFVQHGDPFEDPDLKGMSQAEKVSQKSVVELKKYKESIKKLLNEAIPVQPKKVNEPVDINIDKKVVNNTPSDQINMTDYDINSTFSNFDKELKSATEDIKIKYQKAIQDKILGKKIILRASKGYKQPEEDYTINVIGVQIDYYYDRYCLVIVGREEKKQDVHKFFVKTGFKIRILGNSNRKGDDNYQISKYREMTNNNDNVSQNNSDNIDVTEKIR